MILQSIVQLKPCPSVKLISQQKNLLLRRPVTITHQKIETRVQNSLYEKEFVIFAHSVVSMSLFFYMICYRHHHLKELKMIDQNLELSRKKTRLKRLSKKQKVSK